MIYADTSFLVSAYVPDANSDKTLIYLAKNKPRLPFAFLHWPEMSKAIFGFAADAETVWNDVNADLLGGVRLYRSGEDCERVARRAAGLMRHNCKRWPSLHSLDVLHVATAIELGSKTLLSFDSQQRVLAHVQKLEVWPELHSLRKTEALNRIHADETGSNKRRDAENAKYS